MATTSSIKLSPSQQPAFYLPPLTQESADMASKCLQKNHDEHHVFFNMDGFHDHIVHQMLSLFALGATPAEIEQNYNNIATIQRPKLPTKVSVVADMHNPENFKNYLGNEEHYPNYLAFFKEEIDSKGWQNMLNEYLFARDERADDMLVRMFSGLMHPLIHLGFGIEFEQPAIIAEAMAQAAVHPEWLKPLYLPAEQKAASHPSPGKPLTQLLDEMSADKKLTSTPLWSDENKLRSLLERAADHTTDYLAQYRATAATLDAQVAEMMNLCTYYSAAAQHPSHRKQVKFDFYYIHAVNCSIFFPMLMRQTWLREADKVRLLEWKSRMDLTIYIFRGTAELDVNEVTNYVPKKQNQTWDSIGKRACVFPDDGHVPKLVRALAHAEETCAEFEGQAVAAEQDWRITGDMWLTVGNMAIDSVEGTEEEWVQKAWVRCSGFDEAWEPFGEREGLDTRGAADEQQLRAQL